MRRLWLLALLGVLCFPVPALAGGWTQPPGESYVKVWGTAVPGSLAFDLDGDLIDTQPFSLLSLSAYGEYGLREDLTLVTSLQPLGVASYGTQRRGYSGRSLAGFRQRLVSAPIQLAIEARFGGSPGFGGERDLAAQDDYEFRPSVRTWVTEWELQVGLPIGTVGWVTGSIGPRWLSNPDLQPVLHGFAQVGFGPFAGFVFDLHLTLNHTFERPELLNVTGASDTRYAGVGLGVSWWIVESFAFHIGGDGALYAVSNAGAPSLQIGIEFRN